MAFIDWLLWRARFFVMLSGDTPDNVENMPLCHYLSGRGQGENCLETIKENITISSKWEACTSLVTPASSSPISKLSVFKCSHNPLPATHITVLMLKLPENTSPATAYWGPAIWALKGKTPYLEHCQFLGKRPAIYHQQNAVEYSWTFKTLPFCTCNMHILAWQPVQFCNYRLVGSNN